MMPFCVVERTAPAVRMEVVSAPAVTGISV